MAVSLTVTLPAQPATGAGALFTPFGGNGRSAPLGVYDVGMQLVGDAGGGNATLTCVFDQRYTSMVSYVLPQVIADTTAGEFMCQIVDTNVSLPNVRILGTLPGITEATLSAVNSSFLWYPPPLYLPGSGNALSVFVNVDATETYAMDLQIFVFDRNVRQLTAMNWLNQLRVGVNSIPGTG